MTVVATEGRTYIDYRWDIRPGAREYFSTISMGWRYEDKDVTEVQTPHVVPNGKWVMERPCRWAQLVGVKSEELELLEYTGKHGERHCLYVSDKPFGFIMAEDGEYVRGQVQARLVGDLRLYSAQQIHKGELTQNGVPFPKLTLVREDPSLARKYGDFPRNRSQKRNHVRWARLADAVAASGLPDMELIHAYWRFVGFSVDHAHDRHGTFLHVVYGSAEEVASPDRKIEYYSRSEFDQTLWWTERYHEMWIRAGLAKTILQLLSLGVTPEFLQTQV